MLQVYILLLAKNIHYCHFRPYGHFGNPILLPVHCFLKIGRPKQLLCWITQPTTDYPKETKALMLSGEHIMWEEEAGRAEGPLLPLSLFGSVKFGGTPKGTFWR